MTSGSMHAIGRRRLAGLALAAGVAGGALLAATGCSSSADDKSKPDPAPGSSVPAFGGNTGGTPGGSAPGTTIR